MYLCTDILCYYCYYFIFIFLFFSFSFLSLSRFSFLSLVFLSLIPSNNRKNVNVASAQDNN